MPGQTNGPPGDQPLIAVPARLALEAVRRKKRDEAAAQKKQQADSPIAIPFQALKSPADAHTYARLLMAQQRSLGHQFHDQASPEEARAQAQAALLRSQQNFSLHMYRKGDTTKLGVEPEINISTTDYYSSLVQEFRELQRVPNSNVPLDTTSGLPGVGARYTGASSFGLREKQEVQPVQNPFLKHPYLSHSLTPQMERDAAASASDAVVQQQVRLAEMEQRLQALRSPIDNRDTLTVSDDSERLGGSAYSSAMPHNPNAKAGYVTCPAHPDRKIPYQRGVGYVPQKERDDVATRDGGFSPGLYSCSYCHKPLHEISRFCSHCGAPQTTNPMLSRYTDPFLPPLRDSPRASARPLQPQYSPAATPLRQAASRHRPSEASQPPAASGRRPSEASQPPRQQPAPHSSSPAPNLLLPVSLSAPVYGSGSPDLLAADAMRLSNPPSAVSVPIEDSKADSPAGKKNTAVELDNDEVELSSVGSKRPGPAASATASPAPSNAASPAPSIAASEAGDPSPGSPASKKNTAVANDNDEVDLDDVL
ncbi:hypothetical protein DIPPA_19527 [Diplonema papillatum]|nr:hypothetical protein DIPPA_19527 [Diplonema papillatum]